MVANFSLTPKDSVFSNKSELQDQDFEYDDSNLGLLLAGTSSNEELKLEFI